MPIGISARSRRLPTVIIWSIRPSSGGWRAGGGNKQTEVFRTRYRRRSGIESTNSGLKRRTGLGRLRVRGRARVFQAIYLKITGWNILRAAACATMRKLVQTKARAAVFGLWAWVRTAVAARATSRPAPSTVPEASHGWFLPRLALLRAA